MFGLDNFSNKKKKKRIFKLIKYLALCLFPPAEMLVWCQLLKLAICCPWHKLRRRQKPGGRTQQKHPTSKNVGGITPLCDIIKGQIIKLNV